LKFSRTSVPPYARSDVSCGAGVAEAVGGIAIRIAAAADSAAAAFLRMVMVPVCDQQPHQSHKLDAIQPTGYVSMRAAATAKSSGTGSGMGALPGIRVRLWMGARRAGPAVGDLIAAPNGPTE
jgi:hypothetical protein